MSDKKVRPLSKDGIESLTDAIADRTEKVVKEALERGFAELTRLCLNDPNLQAARRMKRKLDAKGSR